MVRGRQQDECEVCPGPGGRQLLNLGGKTGRAQVALKGHSILGLGALRDWGVWFQLKETKYVDGVWSLKCEQEVEKNKALTEALQTLDAEHHDKSRRSSTPSSLTEDDFYDAASGQQPLKRHYVTIVP
ncbi:Oxysterol-binding protein-related protein 1 [Liparis tanakae]|uniref:Oxysterol-binding protein-related protein 1 n=1 Tax=Liparis tanakae TaxID=230148 RepID=A0A4Z2G877_9TELE|nr:Oxysterol-binding protein-related protein 1 [Liparis tanakae]